MKRVVRRVINHKYVAMNPHILVEGTIIDFDCYIKRFDDYVIIIESGTLITPELAKTINQNQEMYISIYEIDKVNVYTKQYGVDNFGIESKKIRTVQEMLPIALTLNEELKQVQGFEAKIEKVYQTTAALMEAIFHEMNETLPLNALGECTEGLIDCLNIPDISVIPVVLRMMPHDYSTHHHSTNVAMLSIILGKSIGLKKEELSDVAYAGLVHDIGKIRIDRYILLKPTSLEDDEYELIKRHADYGLEILRNNGLENQKVLDGVHYHHEKLDGSGYPKKLRGKRIPKVARIIGMCDVFDALTTRRTYRSDYSSYEAILLIKQEMAEQFDEHYIDAFIRLLGPQ